MKIKVPMFSWRYTHVMLNTFESGGRFVFVTSLLIVALLMSVMIAAKLRSPAQTVWDLFSSIPKNIPELAGYTNLGKPSRIYPGLTGMQSEVPLPG